jgi:hypothetical protein
MRRRLTIATVALLLCAGAGGSAGGKTAKQEDPAEPPSFARDVMPVLGRYCENCHGDREQHGGLRLDNYDNLMRGGDSGPAIVAGNPRQSLLIAKVEHRDQPSMPPRKWLPKAAIARIKAWITAGAEP